MADEYLGRVSGQLMQKLSAALNELPDEDGYKSVSAFGDLPEENDDDA